MQITKDWLEKQNACEEGTQWFLNQNDSDHIQVIKALIKNYKFDWANWALTNLMSHTQQVQYACYAAKQSLHLFEKLCPNDKRPREAILAAYKWSKDLNEENRDAAWSAARAAAWSAARAAAEAAAWSAEAAAWSAARAAAEAAAWRKILKYGLRLTKGA
jgi:hypothetical protein